MLSTHLSHVWDGNMTLGIELREGLTRPDPLLTFRWVARDVPFGEQFGVTPAYIETFELPFNNVKADGVFMGGGYQYFPMFHDISAFGVTFYGDSQNRVIRYLNHWKSRVKNFKTGIYQLPGYYKRRWLVSLLDPAGNEVATAELSGCWPADTGQISLDYNDGSGRILLNQNFSVDDCTFIT